MIKISTVCMLVPTMALHFVYVHPAGRSGFVDRKWVRHVDIFKYRRFQSWELIHPIDWDEGDRKKIDSTRFKLDKDCSTYDVGSSIPGDPGDYLKEVAGHPTSSGYNRTLSYVITLWTAAISMFYFSCPILLLALWWKVQTTGLVIFYILVQLFPMALLVASASFASLPMMCAMDIIYGRQYLRSFLIAFIVVVWLYEIVKFVILILFCVEQHLAKKRKGYGFRKRRHRTGQVVPESSVSESTADAGNHPDHDNFDVERAVAMERKRELRRERKTNPILGHSIALQILQIGSALPPGENDGAPRSSMVADTADNLNASPLKHNVSFSQFN
ncbi:unnamed protein product [Orchesella dallaii]|uniref:Uncharacterized protein n=1 Tax=Orchesella dallaii TaxID=48710 RepID=A0ABP1RU41_9HEXA